jgi:hypothetical protein
MFYKVFRYYKIFDSSASIKEFVFGRKIRRPSSKQRIRAEDCGGIYKVFLKNKEVIKEFDFPSEKIR